MTNQSHIMYNMLLNDIKSEHTRVKVLSKLISRRVLQDDEETLIRAEYIKSLDRYAMLRRQQRANATESTTILFDNC